MDVWQMQYWLPTYNTVTVVSKNWQWGFVTGNWHWPDIFLYFSTHHSSKWRNIGPGSMSCQYLFWLDILPKWLEDVNCQTTVSIPVEINWHDCDAPDHLISKVVWVIALNCRSENKLRFDETYNMKISYLILMITTKCTEVRKEKEIQASILYK